MNVALPSDLAGFVHDQVAGGHFSSEQEIICQGLRLLQKRNEQLAQLKQEVQVGLAQLERGEGIVLDDTSLSGFFADVEAEVQRELDAQPATTLSSSGL
jgi:antitoxin ParD1/3/4